MEQDKTSALGRAAEAGSAGPVSMYGVQGEWTPESAKTGICCSGGGIRSASFNLGALQALQRKGVFGKASYLTSVSGGGYMAGAMTMLAGSEESLVWADGRPKPFEPGTREERYLRNRSSYLAPGMTGKLRLLANLLRGLLLNLVVLGAALIVAGWGVGWIARYVTAMPERRAHHNYVVDGIVHYARWPLPLFLVAMAGVMLLYRGIQRPRSAPQEDGELRAVRWVFGAALFLWAALVAAPWAMHYAVDLASSGRVHDLLDKVYGLVGKDLPEGKDGVKASTGTFGQIAAVLGAIGLPAIVAGAARSVFRSAGSVLGRIAIWLMVPALCAVGVLAVAISVSQGSMLQEAYAVGGSAAVLVLAFSVADVNAGSMHRFYKRRLCTAFALERVWRDEDGQVAEDLTVPGTLDAIERDYDVPVRMSKAVHGKVGDGSWPQLVCCAAANISDETITPPGRRAVTFTFDSDWIGGPEVGYSRTEDYEQVLGDVRGEDVTIPAAVAISGAALAPCMGAMTKPYLRALLTLANARLGVWLPSSRWIDKHKGQSVRRIRSRPRFTALLGEATGRNRHNSNFLYVTDGGHWENLGLVELLRRGCGTIYCIDESGDHEDTFFTIGQAISMARSELGVEIDLKPDTMRADPKDPTYCTADHVVGTITYPKVGDAAQVTGKIVFIKAQVTRAAPWDVRAYKEKDPAFPNHSLLAQMFMDQTFEAYRALGYHAAEGAVRSMTKEPPATITLPTQRGEKAAAPKAAAGTRRS
jgi:hypothetical protein